RGEMVLEVNGPRRISPPGRSGALPNARVHTDKEKFLKLGNWQRLGIEVPLRLLALCSLQECGLRESFDALGDDFQAEVVRHGYDRANNGRVFPRGVIGNLAHKTLINLDPRERVAREITQ